MAMPISKMTAKEYERALEELELSNYEFCKLIGVNDRTGRAWINGQYLMQLPTAGLLRLAVRLKVSPARLAKLISEPL
jgi:DNA-binding transcriptional regulator YiaG